MITLSSHVLDTTSGKPACNLNITLTITDGSQIQAVTNEDGRCNDWGEIEFVPGVYCLRFHTGKYLHDHYQSAFYPFVDVNFTVTEDGHHHIPLLISPHGYSSYRGS